MHLQISPLFSLLIFFITTNRVIIQEKTDLLVKNGTQRTTTKSHWSTLSSQILVNIRLKIMAKITTKHLMVNKWQTLGITVTLQMLILKNFKTKSMFLHQRIIFIFVYKKFRNRYLVKILMFYCQTYHGVKFSKERLLEG